ncbi:MAG TPA: hypothetical protein VF192_07765 [Longimicrobiales bacterium]|jgi:hypothetical protein
MFVGHYAVSYAGKSLAQPIPLWHLFIAVQFLDVLWGLFVFLGIERVRIVPGITAASPLDLYHVPYTHSLVGALFWSMAGGAAYHVWRGRRAGSRAGVIIGTAVFSHWVLDLLVHRPDLPLVGNRFKMGFGLWNFPAVALALEATVLFGGLLLYLRATRRAAPSGTFASILFGIGLVLIQALIFFGPPPGSPSALAATGLVAYGALAGVAAWLERKRAPAAEPAGVPAGFRG